MTIATLLIALITVPTSVGGSGEPIMLDFTATWCGPCREMRPVVERLVELGYPIKPVDVDRSPDLAERYQVTGVPAFIVIDPSSGRELGRTEGARPAAELASLYNQAKAKFGPRPRVGAEEPS
ncbi:MAG: thioredoxin family protein, partial [Planctomycetia bacterium]|nr:thioredoxin family protein [Planctomycetia bacterium]